MENQLVGIGGSKLRQGVSRRVDTQRILLVKPPFFAPWTPPLGIGILKSYLENSGHSVTCFDYNVDPVLWGTHHEYFGELQKRETVAMNDGYSKLWWVLNAHMLSFANGAAAEVRKQTLGAVIRFYGVRYDPSILNPLDRIVARYFDRLEELTAAHDLSSFSLLGTSTYTTSLASSLHILKLAKARYPELKTVMGGGVFADDLALGSENLEILLSEYPFVDHVVLGEGEVLMEELLGGSLGDKRVVSIADLGRDTLSIADVPVPDFSDFSLASYYHLSIEGARSCPFQCSFCSETIQWGDYRKKPQAEFVRQVTGLADRYGNNAFFMGDSLMDPYIMGFSRELLKINADVKFDGYLRADKIAGHRDKARLWASAGLYRVRLGVESASGDVLKAMHKMTSPHTISEALKSLANAGIRTTTYWIVGFPGETEENFVETLDFIYDHHKLIYELEAHPYYYYPYGQVGSRFFESFSIYPEEVTDVTRFKVWEVKDIEPDREERYDRLRRISELASRLGIPNIYTMTQKYEAEERWHRLHPSAVEVFEGALARRSSIPRLEKPLPGRLASFGPHAVLAYRVSVKKALDENLLAEALVTVARQNEMLQLRFEDGYFHAVDEEALPELEVTQDDRPGSETRSLEKVDELVNRMSACPGASLKLLLIRVAEDRSELFLLLHRDLGDARSAALICEDIFWAYEQLCAGRTAVLRPIDRPFTQLEGVTAEPAVDCPGPRRDSRERVHNGRLMITLDDGFRRCRSVLQIEDYGALFEELFVAAVLRAWKGRDRPKLEATVDARWHDRSLERTVGPLTGVRTLASSPAWDRGLETLLEDVRGQLRRPATALSVSLSDSQERRCLLNLEALASEPWLGGDHWIPRGFVDSLEEPWPGRDIEVRPTRSDRELRVEIRWRRREVAEVAESLAELLPEAFRTVVDHCRTYQAAERFWAGCLEGSPPVPVLDLVVSEEGEDAEQQGWTSERVRIASDVVDLWEASYGSMTEFCWLAAFSILLSRLSGREEIWILCDLEREGRSKKLPLLTHPDWKRGFSDLVSDIGRRFTRAAAHLDHAESVVSAELAEEGGKTPRAPFDVGYVFSDSPASTEDGSGHLFHTVLGNDLSLIFTVTADSEGYGLWLSYRPDRISSSRAGELGEYFERLLAGACRDPMGPISEVPLSEPSQFKPAGVSGLAVEDFNF